MNTLYDISRLLECRHAVHATGVDRVDLRYLLWMLEYADHFCPVLQTSRGMVCYRLSEFLDLLQELSARWLDRSIPATIADSLSVEGQQPFPVLDTNLRLERWRALAEKFKRVSWRELLRERGVGAVLLCRMAGRRSKCRPLRDAAALQGWTYVNVGHCFRFEAAMQSIPATMRRIYFLHDVIPLTHPEYQKPTSAAHFKKFCEYVGHPKSDVIVSSQATLDAIAGLPEDARALLNSASSIRVCPLAVEERFMAQRLKSLKGGRVEGLKVDERKDSKVRDYFLSVGTIEPRKNLELLVRVWEQLLDSGGAIPKLIWVGKFGWSNDKQLMRRFERLQALGHVELCSGVPDADLLRLMQGAIALLFPSKVEGWGLPLSEAFAMGVAVIASDITVFREVGQGVPELLELEDVEGWQSMIVQYAMADSAFRALQIQRMRRNEPLAWAQHFEQLEALLNAQGPE